MADDKPPRPHRKPRLSIRIVDVSIEASGDAAELRKILADGLRAFGEAINPPEAGEDRGRISGFGVPPTA